MKYIILAEHPDNNNIESPVLFPEWLLHKNVAAGRTCVSAGYVKITPDGVVCYDSSDSLKLTPRPQDADIIAMALRMTAAPKPTTKKPHAFDILGLRTL